MYICVCNEITEQDLIDDPELWDQCGTQCGTCKEFVGYKTIKDFEHCEVHVILDEETAK